MSFSSTQKHWILWILLSSITASILAYILFNAQDKKVFMPGQLSNGHHQFADKCETCHTDSFGDGEVLQKACIKCHGEQRVKPFDSHPRNKFTDPRNADRLEKIDAIHCVTCHTEHKPEITLKNGLTQPKDFCFHCHQDIAEKRPSHVNMKFDTCANAGCHNFHNNRALYTDFLINRLDNPDIKNKALLPAKEFSKVLDQLIDYPRDNYPIAPLQKNNIDAPAQHKWGNKKQQEWLKSKHAKAGVNCSACHQVKNEKGELTEWQKKPDQASCNQCHNLEVKRFGEGKHGMRIAEGLSPMTPAQARLPMKEKSSHAELTCNSCHGAHNDDVQKAAVESCLKCHDDKHSRAYKYTPHHQLWLKEITNQAPPNSGVSCASCHMPRIDHDVNDWMSRTMVDHNQNNNLSPNSKMIRTSCLHCHGLEMSIDALADQALINRNFDSQPSVHVKSMDLARADHERYLKEKNQPEN